MEFAAALQSFSTGSQEGINQLVEFKNTNPEEFVISLIQHLSDSTNPEITRKICAVFLYKEILPRNARMLKQMLDVWFRFDMEIHEQLRVAATSALFEGSDDLTQQTAQLLGLFYALEFIKNQFAPQFNELLQIAAESREEPAKCAALLTIKCFLVQSVYLNQEMIVTQSQTYQNVSQPIFDILLSIAQNPESPDCLKIVVSSIVEAAPFFYRTLSFSEPRDALMEVIFSYIGNEELFEFGYRMLDKLIEYFFPLLDPYMENVFALTSADIQSENESRVIHSCIVWQNIGVIESTSERRENFYSPTAFTEFFETLVTMIASSDPMDTELGTLNDMTPQNAAFSCILELAKAIGEDATEPIFAFVRENIQHEDWRIRYCSVLLLYVATKISTFSRKSEDILGAFTIFISCLEDEAPVVVEKAMWALGIMCVEIQDLPQDAENFEALITKSAAVMNNSKVLFSRVCWLLSNVFTCFSPEDESVTLLAENFDVISDMLVTNAQAFGQESVHDAYGALNILIEQVPRNMPESYNTLLEKIMVRLGELLQAPSKDTIGEEIWICSIIQAVTMNAGQSTSPYADKLMEMLQVLITQHNNELTTEVLPAVGAIARALGPQFATYAPPFIELVLTKLLSEEYLEATAVFVGDVYMALGSLTEEANHQFVEYFSTSLSAENVSPSAKGAAYAALASIAKNTVPWCYEWLNDLIVNLVKQVRGDIDDESIFLGITSCCQNIVPLLAEVEGGEKSVKLFYHVFESISKFDAVDGNIIYDALLLLEIITKTFGRKVNVMLNKPLIKKFIQTSLEYDSPELCQKAAEVNEIISQC